MDITIILKIAGIGILVAVICQLLKQTGRDDMAMLVTLAGLVVTLMIVIDLIGGLLNNVRQVFELY
ncbi:MAG: stage III sporulation protein AC [Eubacteriales bacterium]|nr:stage III sporulation protein AC [Eubacteriales bacterium]